MLFRSRWGVDKKSLNDCNVTVKDGVVSVLNGYIPVASTEYTAKNNGDGTYTVTAVSTSKNYIGSKTVKADGKAEWSYVKKKYKLNTTNFLFLCNC